MTFSPCIIQLDLISQAYYLLDPECRPLNFQRGLPIFLPLLHNPSLWINSWSFLDDFDLTARAVALRSNHLSSDLSWA